MALFRGREGPWGNGSFWDWKFHASPAGPAVGSVVVVEGSAVGQIGSFPVRVMVGGKELLGAHDHDLIIDPRHRSMKSIFELTQARPHINAGRGIAFLYGCAPADNAKLFKGLAHAEGVAAIPQMRRRIDLTRTFERRLPVAWLARPAAACANRLWARPAGRRPPLPEGVRATRLERFDARFDALWRRCRDDYAVMTVRDASTLNWRFVDIPNHPHHLLCIERGDQVLGYAVLLEEGGERACAQIVELVTPKDAEPFVASELIARCIEWAGAGKTSSLQCWMFPHCHLRRPLLEAGFFPDEAEGYELIVRRTFLENPVPGDPEPPPGQPDETLRDLLRDPRSWFLSIGDADLF